MNKMVKSQPRGWRSKALPFPQKWFSDRALFALADGWAHNCFPLLSAGRRGTRFCRRTWRADATVGREPNHIRGGEVGRQSAPRAGAASGHELHPDLTNQAMRQENWARRTKVEQWRNRKWRAQPGRERLAADTGARSPPSRESAQGPPTSPPQLPPGCAPARRGRLACPRPLLLFLFLVPGRASGSEEPGEAVPGGAAPPPAAGHLPGAAAGPRPSPGNA